MIGVSRSCSICSVIVKVNVNQIVIVNVNQSLLQVAKFKTKEHTELQNENLAQYILISLLRSCGHSTVQ